MLEDHGHEIGEIDRRVAIEVRIEERCVELLCLAAPVVVALRHALDDAHDRFAYLTLRERATSCLTEIVAAGHCGESR
jgi:hypothetical protein